MSVARAAKKYIQVGFSVTPTKGKTPILDNWPGIEIALEDIPRYFNNGQNVGVKTGAFSDWRVDVDLDVREAQSIAGRFLPPTLTHGRKSAPHSHWWYRSPGAKSASFKDVDNEVLLEIRANGRQTVVPPSTHPDGDRYVWHGESGLEIAQTSAEELARAVKELATATLISRHVPPVGGRHDFALALAGYMLRDERLAKATVLNILIAAWHAASADSPEAKQDLEGVVECTVEKLARGEEVIGGRSLEDIVPGLPRVIAKYWGWGRDHETGGWEDPVPLPEGLPPVMEIDPEMLPEAFRGWLCDIAERMQVPLDFLAAGAMTVAASVVGRKVGIRPKRLDDWVVVPNFWGAVVGRPALLKSPALGEVMKPLDKLIDAAYEHHAEAFADYEVEAAIAEAKRAAFKDGLKKRARKAAESGDQSGLTEWAETEGRIDGPSEPTVRRYKTEDPTVEKLCELLVENPDGLLVHRDELSGWLRSLDKHGREGDRAFYLESWNGTGSFDVDRIGRGSIHIPAVCLSILGGIQPGPLSGYVLQATQGEKGDDGLLQRFQLLVWPDPPARWRNVDRYPDAEAKDRAYAAFERLDSLMIEATNHEDDERISTLRFASKAQELFDTWRAELERRIREENMPPALESHLAKYRSLMPSLALLFELIDSEKGLPAVVGEEAALRATAWCEYLESHARRLYSAAEKPEMASARALLERIRRGDVLHGTTVREVYRREFAKLATPAEVKAAAGVLSEFGWLRTIELETGGRVSTRIEFHPSLRDTS
jgi:putative DNA primase/helicase